MSDFAYTPVATVVDWHDGDTFHGYVDFGCHFWMGGPDDLLRFRCAKIDAPELRTGLPGDQATAYAEKIAPPGRYQATSTGIDTYGRPILDLHLPSGLFSAVMLAAHQATPYAR